MTENSLISRLGDAFSNAIGNVSSQMSSALQASSASAIEAERQATAEANAFNAAQAALNRQFQQSSADRSMQFEAEQARIARDFSASEAQKQRDYETQMSNTAYQRAVRDLEAAGLNPMLLYTHLSNASTPSGASAQTSTAHGSSGSGATASGYKADYSKAKSSDMGFFDNLVPILAISAISSALDAFRGYDMSKDYKTRNAARKALTTVTPYTKLASVLTGHPWYALGFDYLERRYGYHPSSYSKSGRSNSGGRSF